jgi:Ni/Co efflux regulator RcnB
MNTVLSWSRHLLAILITATLAAGPALADKPEGKGKGKGNDKSERVAEPRRDKSRDDDRSHRDNRDKGGRTAVGTVHFADQHRTYVRDYYGQEYSRGFCPPGLAKKNNGCMPPGQAKKWQVGRPLPRDVIFYDLPPRLVVQLGVPPAGHRYVRVAADILLIAIGTGMVIDAIQDLGRM